MQRSFSHLLAGALVMTIPMFTSSSALAAAVCHTSVGDVVIRDTSSCQFVVSGGCEAQCTPINLTASCAAKCEGRCNGSASAECTGNCSANCSGECEADPGSFSCEGSCTADCEASCSGTCAAEANQGECEGTCQSSCASQCNANCEGTPPEATCEAQCEASCNGSCTAQANLECNVDCSGSCTADLSGSCRAKCQEPSGALFCDGQFIDITDVSDCEFQINVEGEASGEARVSSSCATSHGSAPSNREAGLVIAAAVGLLIGRRRKL